MGQVPNQVSATFLFWLVGSRKRLTSYIFCLEIRGVGRVKNLCRGGLNLWSSGSMNVIFGPPPCHVSVVIDFNVIKQ